MTSHEPNGSGVFTHAGCIVVRRTDSGPEVLVVRPGGFQGPSSGRRSQVGDPRPAVWVLPKGHVEPGESIGSAARREALEEAGAVCSSLRFAGSTAFEVKGERVVCAFFAATLDRLVAPLEERARAWLSLDELESAMPYEDTLRLVRQVTDGADAGRGGEGAGGEE